MKKIIVFLLFLCVELQLHAFLSENMATRLPFVKRSAQLSALVPLGVFGLISLLDFLEKKGLKERSKKVEGDLYRIPLLLTIPAAVVGSAFLTGEYAMLNLIQNKSIFEVPVANLMLSTFLQGVAGGLTLFSCGFSILVPIINKLFEDKIEKNLKLKNFFRVTGVKLFIGPILASTFLSLASGVVEIGEIIFAG